jgi:hypothetical protein
MSEYEDKKPRTMLFLVIWACVIALLLISLKVLFIGGVEKDLTGNAAGEAGQKAVSDSAPYSGDTIHNQDIKNLDSNHVITTIGALWQG